MVLVFLKGGDVVLVGVTSSSAKVMCWSFTEMWYWLVSHLLVLCVGPSHLPFSCMESV